MVLPANFPNHSPFGDARVLLKWWHVISTVIALVIAGLMAFGSMKSDVRDAATRLNEHAKAQQVQQQGVEKRLARMETKIDQLLERK